MWLINPYLCFLLFTWMTMTFRHANSEFQLTQRRVLHGIPSASGMALINDRLYVIGDNSPWLFELDTNYEIIRKRHLFGDEFQADSIISKAEKPDLECMEAVEINGRMYLILFGSGSKSPQRDVFISYDLQSEAITKYSLKTFYDHIRSRSIPEGNELNIEGVTVWGDRLILLNRGKNLMLIYSLADFLDFLKDDKPYQEPRLYEIKLPGIQGIPAGFSGATISDDRLLFTASVENTSNAIDDGEILGTFIGTIELNELQNQMQPACTLLTENGNPLVVKVESITLRKISTKKTEILMVTDSDGHYSELIVVFLN